MLNQMHPVSTPAGRQAADAAFAELKEGVLAISKRARERCLRPDTVHELPDRALELRVTISCVTRLQRVAQWPVLPPEVWLHVGRFMLLTPEPLPAPPARPWDEGLFADDDDDDDDDDGVPRTGARYQLRRVIGYCEECNTQPVCEGACCRDLCYDCCDEMCGCQLEEDAASGQAAGARGGGWGRDDDDDEEEEA